MSIKVNEPDWMSQPDPQIPSYKNNKAAHEIQPVQHKTSGIKPMSKTHINNFSNHQHKIWAGTNLTKSNNIG